MAEGSPEQMVVMCACGARLRVSVSAIGKKAKCPKCGSMMAIPASSAPPAPAAAESGGLLDDLASFEKSASAAPASAPGPTGSAACPNCGLAMPPSARLCMACGYDLKAGKALQMAAGLAAPSKAAVLAKSAGTFMLGCVLSLVGALVGGTIWFLVAWFAHFEVGYIAWGIGVLAGVGMVIGHRSPDAKSGAVAVLTSIFGIVAAKAVIFFVVLVSVVTGNSSDIEIQRAFVTANIAEEILDERGVTDPAQREAQWEKVWDEAEARVRKMSDQEIRQKWTEYREERERLDLEEQDAPADARESSDDRPADEPDAPGDSKAPEKGGFAELIALFLRAQFSLFDALWFFLAIGSAWRIGSGGFGKSD